MGCVNIYKNIKFSLILILLFFICVGSISASEIEDNTDFNLDSNINNMELNTISEDSNLDEVECDETDDSGDVSEEEKIIPKKTSITVVNNTVLRNNYLKFYIKDNESIGLSGVKVNVEINGVNQSVTTNSKGLGQLKLSLTADKYYNTVIKFTGNDFYLSSSKSFKTKVIKTSAVLSVKSTTVVKGNYLYVILKDKNSKVLSNQKVYIKFNGKTFTKTTNSKGVASLLIKNAPAKTYTTKLTYKGDANYYSTTKSLKINVKKVSVVLSIANTTVAKGKYLIVYLKTKSGKALANKKVSIDINGRTFTKTTNSKGKASLFISNIATRTYTTTLKYKGNSYYYAKTLKVKIKVIPIKLSKKTKGAIWLWGTDMGNVNFRTLSKNGINNIFVYVTGVTPTFKNFVKKANKYNIKVHAWFGVFHNSKGWVNPLTSKGKYNQKFFNSKINQILKFTKVKGIGGIHLDYLRYPANYGNMKKTKAVTEFTRQLNVAVKKVNPKIKLSASIMPEINQYNSKMTWNEYYYGQDVSALAKYLDIICPMVYKGNYRQSSAWIKSTTATFVKAANGNAEIWTGLQAYVSDSYPKRLSKDSLTLDCQRALDGGASGIALFRWGITNMVKLS